MLQEPFEEGVYEDILERQAQGVAVEDERLKELPAMTAGDYERLGDTYLQRGQIGLARLKYGKALELDPSSWMLQYKIGVLFLKDGSPADSLVYFRSIQVADPTNARGFEGEGRALLALGEKEAAEAALRRAIELDPRLWKAHESLGVLYDQERRLDESVASYRRALAIRPSEPSVLNNLGVAYYLRKDYKESIAVLEQAALTAPPESRRKVQANLGRSLARSGRYAAAFEAFRKGSDVASAYNSLGEVLLDDGKPRRAAACFRKAMDAAPRHYAEARENLAVAGARLDQAGGAASRQGDSDSCF